MSKKILILLISIFILNSNAQDSDPFAEASDAAAKIVSAEVTEESIAKGLNIDWPIKDPEKSVEQIKKETEELIASKLSEQFPVKTFEEFKAELEKEFPVHKVGNTVKVEFRFRGKTDSVTGVYNKLTDKSLVIGGTQVPVVDIKETRLISFDMDLRKKYIHKVGNKRFYDYNTNRDILSEKLTKMYKTSPYKNAGYIMANSKWAKPSAVVKAAYDSKMAEIAKKKAKEEEERKKKEEEEAKKFKFITKADDGTIVKILGQNPQHVYIGAGVLLVLIIGAAAMKK